MRMTLAEALKDDLVALEAGVLCPLPHLDLSGRQVGSGNRLFSLSIRMLTPPPPRLLQLIFVEPRRHTREGYTSESMSRALWYTIEAVAQDNKAVDASIVQILWDRHSTMFDYDKEVHVSFMRLVYHAYHALEVEASETSPFSIGSYRTDSITIEIMLGPFVL